MKKAYLKYIIALLLFGMNGIVASHIALSSYEIVFTRSLIGSLLLALLFWTTSLKTHSSENPAHFFYMVASGVAMGANWMFLYEAYQQIGVSIASLIYCCGPVVVMMLSPILFRENITWMKTFGFLTVLVGMFLVNMQVLSDGQTIWGLFCGVMAAVMYAAMVIFNKKASSITGLENAMWQLIISFVTIATFLSIRQGFSLYIAPENIVPILILGIVNTGLGCYFYFSSIGNLPAQTVALCGYLEPLSAIIFSSIFLSETMNSAQIFGAILILGGAAFGEIFGKKFNSRSDLGFD